MEDNRLSRIYRKLKRYLTDPEEPYLVQSIEEQALFVCKKETVVERYNASTSRFGCGIRENSFKTPPGIHRIRYKIGAGAPEGRVFRERIDSGINWDGQSIEDNLILTRIMWLEGMEEGINKGLGVDSHERYIYIHGTNREDLVGTPLSHGCIALRNADVARVFEIVKEGTLVFIDPPSLDIGENRYRSVHFIGIFGTGMSALAQYLRFQGIDVSGSDRLLSSEDTIFIRQSLEKLGCVIVDQDGSGITDDVDVVCVSTAIEEANLDLAAARTQGIRIVHRSDLLAAIITSKKTIAVAGTSGKSTVTAMVFEFLTACGKSPSLISGAPLRRLEREGLIGNAYSGGSDLLVVEADESDGTLIKYAPEAAVILNVSKDHKEINELKGLFETLAAKSAWTAVNKDDPVLFGIPAKMSFGRNNHALWYPDQEEFLPTSIRLFRHGLEFQLRLPGTHNMENLCAALCVCEHFGCKEQDLAVAVKAFEGVARRFSVIDIGNGIHVVDDFAHNPAKIAAAVSAARGIAERIVAVYQPHGFGPTRFLRDEYISTFQSIFRENDILYLLPIYYAGGTAQRNISSEDIINGLGFVSFHAAAVKDREELLTRLQTVAKKNDCILVMGARDPSLPSFVRKIISLLSDRIVSY